MTYWHMQMHPNNIKWERENEILSENIIGIGDWHDKRPISQIKALKSMKDGDIVLVKRGGTPLALVQIDGDFNEEEDEGDGVGYNEWVYYKRNILILENLLENGKDRDKVPQPRGALQKAVNENSKTYKYIDKWYKEILKDKQDNELRNIEEYQNTFTISIDELKNKLGQTTEIKYKDILEFYKKETKNINSIDIEIENVKSVKKFQEKFTIKLDKGLYTIVGNNGIGKSALLISLGHLIQHTFLRDEFKGDSFENSKITYTFNNLIKFEWKKHNQKDGSKSWTIQDKKFDMPKIDGFFESGIISGSRFENLNFKKEILEKVDKHIIHKSSEASDFIKKELNYIITGKYEKKATAKKNKYNDLFISIIINNEIYFNKDSSGKSISEFSFSTGEYFILALLKLIEKNRDCNKNSLIIIDELDISLHPLAQQRLIEKIEQFKNKFNITFIVATHSLQIIENSKAENLYLFENQDGEISISNPIYPAYVTKNLYKHSYYDKIFLVEDKLAEMFVKRVIKKIDTSLQYKLYYTIIPIGSWEKVLEVTKDSKKYYPNAEIIPLLDEDVSRNNKENNKPQAKAPKWDGVTKFFIPVEDNIERYVLKKLLKNSKFKAYVESELLKDEYQFSNLNLNEFQDKHSTKTIKSNFSGGEKSLIKQIGDYALESYKENYFLIEDKIVEFVFDEISSNDNIYLEFENNIKEFLEIKI